VNPTPIQLSDDVRATLGRSSADAHAKLTHGTKFLLAVTAKAERTGSPVYAGIPAAERARRRAAGKRQRAARRAAR